MTVNATSVKRERADTRASKVGFVSSRQKRCLRHKCIFACVIEVYILGLGESNTTNESKYNLFLCFSTNVVVEHVASPTAVELNLFLQSPKDCCCCCRPLSVVVSLEWNGLSLDENDIVVVAIDVAVFRLSLPTTTIYSSTTCPFLLYLQLTRLLPPPPPRYDDDAVSNRSTYVSYYGTWYKDSHLLFVLNNRIIRVLYWSVSSSLLMYDATRHLFGLSLNMEAMMFASHYLHQREHETSVNGSDT